MDKLRSIILPALSVAVFFMMLYPLLGYSQVVPFTKETIPVVDGKVVFSKTFKANLPKDELQKRVFSYLNDKLDPYSGLFYKNNADSTIAQVTDYIPIDANLLITFGMYMTYRLAFAYTDGVCVMLISEISFMEKSYFETQEETSRKLKMPTFSGTDLMVDGKFSVILMKNVSGRITESALKRINEIVANVDYAVTKK